MVYVLVPINSTYENNACLHTFNSINTYPSKKVGSKKADYVFPWFKTGKYLGKDFIIASSANHLGMFFIQKDKQKMI